MGGKKSLRLRGTCTKNGNTLEITNFPPNTCPYTILKQIEKIALSNPNHIFNNILDGHDESKVKNGRETVRLDLICKRTADFDQLTQALFAETDLETTVPYTLTLVDMDGHAKRFTLADAMEQWYYIYTQKTQLKLSNELVEVNSTIEVLEGLLRALAEIDEIIALIKQSPDTKAATQALISKGYSEPQAKAILNMKLAKLANLEQQELRKNLAAAKARVAEIEALQLNPKPLLLQQLAEVDISGLAAPISKQTNQEKASLKTQNETFVRLVGGKLQKVSAKVANSVVVSKRSPICVVSDNQVGKLTTIEPGQTVSADLIFTRNTTGLIVSVCKDGHIKATTTKEAWSERTAKLVAQDAANILKNLLVDSSATLEIEFVDGTKTTISVADIVPTGRNTKGRRLFKTNIKAVRVGKQ